MTMKRPHRRPRQHRAEIPADLINYLKDEPGIPRDFYFWEERDIRAAWDEVQESILADWIDRYPGRRPRFWWKFEAPEPRQRLGGTGTPCHEVLAHAPYYPFGVPVFWVSQWDADFYNGRRCDVNGNRIGTKYKEGDFAGVPIDPQDPPLYESEAEYLRRLGLLLPGERKRLSPDDFAPEFVEAEADPDDAGNAVAGAGDVTA